MYVLRPDQFGEPRDREFTVQAYGGPTQANLVLETLQLGAQQLRQAARIAEEQRQDLARIADELFGSIAGVAPHWRIPLFGAQLGISTAQSAISSSAMEGTSEAVERAHESYRDTEALVVHWLGAARQVAQYPEMYPHIVHPQGDRALAAAWARTALVNLGHIGVLLFARATRRQPAIRASGEAGGLVSQTLLEEVRRASRASTQTLNVQTQQLTSTQSRGVTDYLEAQAGVAAAGDFSISSSATEGSRRHIVHIPGLELPEDLEDMDLDALAAGELDLSAGRGVNSLADALTNDSENLQTVIDEALQRSGAQPGDELLVSGYSQGALHALNIAAGGRLARRYRISQVVTVAGPGREGPIAPGVRTTSFQDVNDPVPRLMNEQSQLSSARVEINYEHHAPDGQVGGIFGQSHSYTHNLEAIRILEEDANTHLDAGQREHLRELAAQLSGEHQATVYSTEWDAASTERVQQTITEWAGRLQGGTEEASSGVEEVRSGVGKAR
ncbi:hypothetical protein [Nesterenkonia sp. Act20]|uniref:hypothetical protein n=1 Tax=Nesterenkonia sp. Act20 TaxID=1483432 RepID=UPI001C47740D|nr:hypothetical protein [Nesterenkonia sp. Act20]